MSEANFPIATRHSIGVVCYHCGDVFEELRLLLVTFRETELSEVVQRESRSTTCCAALQAISDGQNSGDDLDLVRC